MVYKAILSDAGDVLFDCRKNLSAKTEVLTKLYNIHCNQILSENTVHSKFQPYKRLSQTVMSEEDAINLFFKNNRLNASYNEYVEMLRLKKITNELPSLFPGVTKTLKFLNTQKIPFFILTNNPYSEKELKKMTKKMIENQLKEEENKKYFFRLSKYVTKQISSRDLGVCKPHIYFFKKALKQANLKTELSNCLFVSHKKSELLEAEKQGLSIVAVNYKEEPDASSIDDFITNHQKKYYLGEKNNQAYKIEKFSEITKIINS
ncbi:MAG: HAD family hydrolase [Nanoarchaeota archaeon]|nr:HAD hydrolase-like protein [Nanoarchaeota archaeon]MBU1029714.1 HAD hydrolase-like protein [Nanoarchaeota archaeon]MBU1850119.1 HAD hydrolase-like protein [Nanoarchaeota archaeon]